MPIEKAIVGRQTNMPAWRIAIKLLRYYGVDTILSMARGIQPMSDELLIKKASVIARVIIANYLSKIRDRDLPESFDIGVYVRLVK